MEEAVPMQMPECMRPLDSWNQVQAAIPTSCCTDVPVRSTYSLGNSASTI